MTDTPHDAASLIAWFTTIEIVHHNGTRLSREPLMTMDEARLLAAKIGQKSYIHPYDAWTAERIWNIAFERSLFMSNRYGWIDRNGRFWSCGHAAHETLLHFLNVDIRDAELGGWIRVSMGVQSIFTPSGAQLSTLIVMGYEREAADLMYEGVEPTRAAVSVARVVIPQDASS